MPSPYTPDTSTWHDTIEIFEDGDDADRANVGLCSEQLADNVAIVRDSLDTILPYVPGNHAAPEDGGGIKNIRRGSQADMVALTPTDGDLFIIDNSPYNFGVGLYEYRSVVPLQPGQASSSADQPGARVDVRRPHGRGPGGGQRIGSFSRWTFRSWKTG